MTDTRCPEVAVTSDGFLRCSRDPGHDPLHWWADGRDEIQWRWITDGKPERVGR